MDGALHSKEESQILVFFVSFFCYYAYACHNPLLVLVVFVALFYKQQKQEHVDRGSAHSKEGSLLLLMLLVLN